MSLRRFLRDNSLSVVLLSLFVVFIVGTSIAGWITENQDRQEHKEVTQSYVSYVGSGDFLEAVFENWESEFLQMWALVILTIYLRQKGSEDSKPLRGKTPQDALAKHQLRHAKDNAQRRRAIKYFLYSHSLGLALLLLFIVSFSLHAIGGSIAHNEDAVRHNEPTVSVAEYVVSSQFWFESLQNWQSEFLSVGVLMLLSIKLRERGSPQSKPVGSKFDHHTGS